MMRPIWFLLTSLIVSGISGCGPMMRDLQFANPESRLFPAYMELDTGTGQLDARQAMEAESYVGHVTCDGVTVHYPAGLRPLAEEVAAAFDTARDEIRARTGITWAFTPVVYLVESPIGSGARIRLSLRHGRELKLPLLVHAGRIDPQWSRGIGHELTEASMLASLSKRELVLGDYCIDGSGLVNKTRWFRDGVAEYAGDILNRALFGPGYQPPAWIYAELEQVRDRLLDWSNCADQDSYYWAAQGLIHELMNRFGDDVIAKLMAAASRERYIDGRTLSRVAKRVTGLDLKQFLRDYRVTWLGAEFRDSKRSPGNPFVAEEGNMVTIARIHPGSPAQKWKLRVGDVMLTADGRPLPSASWLVHYLAARRPRDRVLIEIDRAGERLTHKMMVAARS